MLNPYPSSTPSLSTTSAQSKDIFQETNTDMIKLSKMRVEKK
jgi:hypothetical protein